MRDILKYIFNVYKKNLKLKTKLKFRIFDSPYFSACDNCVNMSHSLSMTKLFSVGIRYTIFALLHEIGHAYDYTYNKKDMEEEREKTDMTLYTIDKTYHDSLKYEQRANEFAETELKKWV